MEKSHHHHNIVISATANQLSILVKLPHIITAKFPPLSTNPANYTHLYDYSFMNHDELSRFITSYHVS